MKRGLGLEADTVSTLGRSSHLPYRSEIDGLRAIAVIPVILFHAGIPGTAGGFVGVDVFFVISGFLITSILINEKKSGDFSIIKFYERRARRILPALFLVLAITSFFSWLWMLPEQLKEYSKSLISVIFFASNIFFWRNSDEYFALDSESIPLLHTWSLGVEEQYYMLFPLIFVMSWGFGGARVALQTIVLAVLLSFAAVWLVEVSGGRVSHSFVFYLPVARVWELLVGSACAFLYASGSFAKAKSVHATLLSAIGLALIIAAVIAFDRDTPFPSHWTLLPVVGAALVILFSSGTVVGRLLSAKGFVFVGLISYSAYLWHQPMFALVRVRLIDTPSHHVMGILALAVLPLSYLSWRFVELPFRNTRIRNVSDRRGIFTLSAAASGAFIVFGVAGILSNGWPQRLPEQIALIELVPSRSAPECPSEGVCTIGAAVPPVIAIVGDSHANLVAVALDEDLAARGLAASVVAARWCPPLLGLKHENERKNGDFCNNEHQRRFAKLFADPNIRQIVLVAEWANYTTGYRHASRVTAYSFADGSNTDPGRNPVEFRKALSHTASIARASGKQLMIVGSVPEYDFHVGETAAKSIMYGAGLSALSQPLERFEERQREVDSAFAQQHSSVRVLKVHSVFCDESACYPYDKAGRVLYTDDNHLSRNGLALVKPLILDALDKAHASRP